jgi:predicted RNA-binding protein YlqC (UPF0109 family)
MGAREVLDFVLPWLVDAPDAVEVEEAEGEGDAVVYEITVDSEDMGKVIGKRGRIVRSLRTLVRAAGREDGRPATVEVLD